jgi:hypothetical protein
MGKPCQLIVPKGGKGAGCIAPIPCTIAGFSAALGRLMPRRSIAVVLVLLARLSRGRDVGGGLTKPSARANWDVLCFPLQLAWDHNRSGCIGLLSLAFCDSCPPSFAFGLVSHGWSKIEDVGRVVTSALLVQACLQGLSPWSVEFTPGHAKVRQARGSALENAERHQVALGYALLSTVLRRFHNV